MAAMSGNVKFVKTLLSHYDVDLERECNVIFDGMVVYGATALWVAAGMGHLPIVKMLVQAGAAINHNTKAQSSPLRAACYEGENRSRVSSIQSVLGFTSQIQTLYIKLSY